jgi:hypothetical protein
MHGICAHTLYFAHQGRVDRRGILRDSIGHDNSPPANVPRRWQARGLLRHRLSYYMILHVLCLCVCVCACACACTRVPVSASVSVPLSASMAPSASSLCLSVAVIIVRVSSTCACVARTLAKPHEFAASFYYHSPSGAISSQCPWSALRDMCDGE